MTCLRDSIGPLGAVIALATLASVAWGGNLSAGAENIDPAPHELVTVDSEVVAHPDGVESWSAGDVWTVVLHSAWAVAAAGAIWRRRWLRLRPAGIAEISPTTTLGVPQGAGVMLIAAGIAVWCAQNVGAASARALLGGGPQAGTADNDLWWTASVMGGGYVGAIAALVFVIAMVPHAARLAGLPRSMRDAKRGLVRSIAGFAVIYPIAWAVGWAMAILVSALLGPDAIDHVAHETLRDLAATPSVLARWAVIALVVVAAPLFEEIIYRGLLQPGASLVTGKPWASVIGVSIVFTCVHIDAVSWHALPVLFVLSIGLGIARVRTGGVAAPIVIHALFNAANIALVGM